MIAGLSMPANWRVPLSGAAVFLAGGLAATNWDQLVAFKRDKNLTARETADSVALRPIMARLAWLMVLDRPMWGCGFDQYLPEHLNYLDDRSSDLDLEKFGPTRNTTSCLALSPRPAWSGWGSSLPWLCFGDATLGTCGALLTPPLWVRQQGLLFLAVLSAYAVNGMFHQIALVPMSNPTFVLRGRHECGSTKVGEMPFRCGDSSPLSPAINDRPAAANSKSTEHCLPC